MTCRPSPLGIRSGGACSKLDGEAQRQLLHQLPLPLPLRRQAPVLAATLAQDRAGGVLTGRGWAALALSAAQPARGLHHWLPSSTASLHRHATSRAQHRMLRWPVARCQRASAAAAAVVRLCSLHLQGLVTAQRRGQVVLGSDYMMPDDTTWHCVGPCGRQWRGWPWSIGGAPCLERSRTEQRPVIPEGVVQDAPPAGSTDNGDGD